MGSESQYEADITGGRCPKQFLAPLPGCDLPLKPTPGCRKKRSTRGYVPCSPSGWPRRRRARRLPPGTRSLRTRGVKVITSAPRRRCDKLFWTGPVIDHRYSASEIRPTGCRRFADDWRGQRLVNVGRLIGSGLKMRRACLSTK
jgi:hypothetical protein